MTEHESHGRSKHGPPCTLGKDGGPCTRCRGFEPGHEGSMRHGAYSGRRRRPLINEELARLVEAFGDPEPATLPAFETLAGLRARRRAVLEWLEGVDFVDAAGQIPAVLADVSRWERLEVRLLGELAMTTRARADVALSAAAARNLIEVTEAQHAVRLVYLAAAQFVPPRDRQAFEETVEKAVAGLAAGDEGEPGVLELGPGDVTEDDSDPVEEAGAPNTALEPPW